MSRKNKYLIFYPKLIQNLGSLGHFIKVRIGTHHNSNLWFFQLSFLLDFRISLIPLSTISAASPVYVLGVSFFNSPFCTSSMGNSSTQRLQPWRICFPLVKDAINEY